MEIQALKEAVSQMYKVCDQMEEKTNFHETTGIQNDISISDILKANVLYYMAYLAASDGVISWDETQFIGEILDMHVTPSKLNDLIKENNIYSTEFEEDPPIVLKIFVAMDNALYQNGIKTQTDLGEALLDFYRLITVGLVEANGRTGETMMPEEREGAQLYLGMMRSYIEGNTEKIHTDIILDYGKCRRIKDRGSGGVRAPKKNRSVSGSVKAPKKKV